MTPLLTPYEQTQLHGIKVWLHHHETPLSQALATALHPLEENLIHRIPRELIEQLHQACDQLTDDWQSDWAFLQKYLTKAKTWEDLRDGELTACDRIARDIQKIAQGKAALEAGFTSLLEGLGEVANVGLMILLSLTMIQRMGLAYGFPPDTPARKGCIWGILALSLADSPEERQRLLQRMARSQSDLYQAAVTQLLDKSVEDAAEESTSALLERILVAFAAELGGEAIPVIGTLLGIRASTELMQSVGETAQRAWQLRWLVYHQKLIPQPAPNLIP
ncbi:EcsC family protein [Synechococcus sp. PCC 6312]|uniref:EcsC family protein n=1 Tax=Synechococcus sp. (strain ATCC 27167 / PCC 6312) TaxID=195253 RepID=UPI00029ED571|nr:EcsC family protein [Synechococcus sp. PCC 6312]AFY62108.1 hypothetical protein Syn6312_3056 [Synechococcus sp. PCC 6312]